MAIHPRLFDCLEPAHAIVTIDDCQVVIVWQLWAAGGRLCMAVERNPPHVYAEDSGQTHEQGRGWDEQRPSKVACTTDPCVGRARGQDGCRECSMHYHISPCSWTLPNCWLVGGHGDVKNSLHCTLRHRLGRRLLPASGVTSLVIAILRLVTLSMARIVKQSRTGAFSPALLILQYA